MSHQCDNTECYVRWQNWNAERDMALDRALIAEVELTRLRAELRRAADVIGAQTFDLPRLAKGRRRVLVKLADELLQCADGVYISRRIRTPLTSKQIRDRFPDDLGQP